MEKFKSNDILTDLSAIMKLNTAFYQTDFDIDKEILLRSAMSDNPQDKYLLWLSRPSGTQCHLERDVFMKDTYPFNNWKFFAEQTSDKILAYAVHILGYENGTIRGDLYPLDYPKHVDHVKKHAFAPATVTLYTKNNPINPKEISYQEYKENVIPFASIDSTIIHSDDPISFQNFLNTEITKRDEMSRLGDFTKHIIQLGENRITDEAERISAELLSYPKPNSPAETHFMTKLSVYFATGITNRDLERLMDKIPFHSLSFSKIKGKEGLQALVSKEEIREFQKGKKSSIKDLLDAAKKESEKQTKKARTDLPDKKKGVER